LEVNRDSGLRLRTARRLKSLAVAVNVVLFAVGLYFEVYPRDRHDVWSAAGVAAVAIVNSAALTIGTGGRRRNRFRVRLRRIGLIANTFLVATGLLLAGVEVLGDSGHALIGLALVVPPLITIAALRREPPA
jgi:O-antigen/teichoic acid export membrane protein